MLKFGVDYNEILDGERLRSQTHRIRDFMLRRDLWWTLTEISAELGDPEASISAQLRHLRKEKFGAYRVEKRRRSVGTWEYRVLDPSPKSQLELNL